MPGANSVIWWSVSAQNTLENMNFDHMGCGVVSRSVSTESACAPHNNNNNNNNM